MVRFFGPGQFRATLYKTVEWEFIHNLYHSVNHCATGVDNVELMGCEDGRAFDCLCEGTMLLLMTCIMNWELSAQ